jgi:hypothetical protein
MNNAVRLLRLEAEDAVDVCSGSWILGVVFTHCAISAL